jgi:hypothetical protein
MKNHLLLILFLVNIVFSRDANLVNNPATYISGVQINEMTTPGNFSELVLNYYTPLQNNNNLFDNNYSFEFAPFYFTSKNETYYDLEKFNFLRDTRISFASTNINLSDELTANRLSFGFRTILNNGNLKNETTKLDAALSQKLNKFIVDVENGEQQLSNYFNYLDSLRKKVEITDDDYSKLKIISNYKIELNDITDIKTNIDNSKEYSIYDLTERTGFIIDLNSALSVDINELEYVEKSTRLAIWSNFIYRYSHAEKLDVDFVGILRVDNYSFIPNQYFEDNSVFADLGIGIDIKLFKKIDLAVDYVFKTGFVDGGQTAEGDQIIISSVQENKLDFTLGYKINDQFMWSLNYSEIKSDPNLLDGKLRQLLTGFVIDLNTLLKQN